MRLAAQTCQEACGENPVHLERVTHPSWSLWKASRRDAQRDAELLKENQSNLEEKSCSLCHRL